jgi:hypothetical protein
MNPLAAKTASTLTFSALLLSGSVAGVIWFATPAPSSPTCSPSPAGRPPPHHLRAGHPRPQIKTLLHGQAHGGSERAWSTGGAHRGAWWMWGATQDKLLVAFPGCCWRCLLVIMPPRLYCQPQFQPPHSAAEHNSELLQQVRSLFSPSCLFAKVCIFFPVDCVCNTRCMDGFFVTQKKLCASAVHVGNRCA